MSSASEPTNAPFLMADIGGTHARFAIATVDASDVKADVMMVAGIATLEDALDQYLGMKNVAASDLAGAVLCAAGPVQANGSIEMTNCPWVLEHAAIAKAHPFPTIRILNDMSAAALGLLRLKPNDTLQIGGKAAEPTAPKAIVAPGTGLGVSGLVRGTNGTWSPLPSEGGHVDLAPQSEREIAVVFHLLRQFGHVSVERVLSGPGLETLHAALCALDGATSTGKLLAVDIVNAAKRKDPLAREALDLFCGWLGSVAGDLTITLGARGGLYIGGGIIPQWGELGSDAFDQALFRRRFEAKGRFAEYMAPIPAYLVKRPELALLGCLEHAQASVA